MPRTQTVTKNPKSRAEPEGISIRIVSFRRNYFIARSETGDASFADDEAILDIDGIIERAGYQPARHVDQSISVRLINSKRYTRNQTTECQFFGTVTLRGQTRSVLAYLPADVFWALPRLFTEGASIVQVTVELMSGGYGDLVSLYVGCPDDPLTGMA